MIILLCILSMFLSCFYIVSLATGNFFSYIKSVVLEKPNSVYKHIGYIEAFYIVLTLINSVKGSQSMIFIFILLGWILSWAMFIRVYDILVDKRKGYLFLVVNICIYLILTIINIDLLCQWIRTI